MREMIDDRIVIWSLNMGPCADGECNMIHLDVFDSEGVRFAQGFLTKEMVQEIANGMLVRLKGN